MSSSRVRDRLARGAGAFFAAAAGCVAALCVAPHALAAQATLSTQGFGYPPGQWSARAEGTGGAVAQTDPLSAVNPASLAGVSDQLLFFEAQPEFRRVNTGSGSDRTTLSRFPEIFAAIPAGSRWVVGFGSSTLLDRTSGSSVPSSAVAGSDTVGVNTSLKLNGAIDDVRLALALQSRSWLQLGVGLHAITGRNLVTLAQTFTDTTTFTDFSEERQLSYEGGALSAGAVVSGHGLRGSASYRYGGPMRVTAEDTLLGKGRVPNHFGASLAYTGIKNSTIAFSMAHDGWSSMGTMGTPSLVARDSWDTSVGADMAGPDVAGHVLQLRAGFRRRDLPFEAAGSAVSERSIAGGLGAGWAGGHVITDLSLTHANRSATGITETAWIMSMGLTIRP